MSNPMGNRRVDRILRHIPARAPVVMQALRRLNTMFGQMPPLELHLVRRLPGADDHFAHPPHGLRIGRHNTDGAHIVQDILGRNRLTADTRLGEGDVFRHARVQVVADHEHVEMLIHRIDRERHGGIRRRRQYVRLTAHFNDVRRMSAAGAFRME